MGSSMWCALHRLRKLTDNVVSQSDVLQLEIHRARQRAGYSASRAGQRRVRYTSTRIRVSEVGITRGKSPNRMRTR